MLVAIGYDIRDDKRRVKLSKLLGSYGERVQYSMFEIHLSEAKLQGLRQNVLKLIEPSCDSVRYYRLGEAFEQRVLVDGVGLTTEELEFVIV